MLKKIISLLFVTAGTMFLLGFTNGDMTITDFNQYKNLTQKPVLIKVLYLSCAEDDFIIDDESQIKEIVEILFNDTVYVKDSNDIRYGGSGIMIFVDGNGVETIVNISRIKSGNNFYIANNSNLFNKLLDISQKQSENT